MLKKLIRTGQNYVPFLAEAKNDFYYLTRRYLGAVHDREFAVVAALTRSAEDLFVDIGANRGQSILAIRHFRPDARIVSFEPNPAIFRHLHRRFGKAPGVRLESVGLAAEPGEMTLFVPSYRGFVYDGVATFSRQAAETYLGPDTLFRFDPALLQIAEHHCPVRTLDSFALQPTFIKIDVEGLELQVLQGATETLRRHGPALMLERFYPDARVAPMLAEFGYKEVVLREGRLVPGSATGLNMLLMTDRHD